MHLYHIDFKKVIVIVILLFGMMGTTVLAQQEDSTSPLATVSPLDFGLETATTDSARYEVLLATHTHAIAAGANVSYKGIGTLTIEVPALSSPIPLSQNNDFDGLVLTVKNYAKAKYLFSMMDTLWSSIDLGPTVVDNGDFAEAEDIQDGLYLVVMEDLYPWVDKRTGYNYGAMRKDILLVQNRKALNRPVSPYATDSTRMRVKYQLTDDKLKTIANLTIIRDTTSTAKTYCFSIEGINNLKISNLKIQTENPRNLYADAAITIANCTNVTFEDVQIEGTYSRKNQYGYGIRMDNVWKSLFVNLKARADWGIFGTNNLSNTTLRNCDINRFDIHCYGRDVYFHNCSFGNLYNQFSSLYGTLLYDGCRFTDFVPVLLEPSYNAYTGFDVTFKDCIFDALPNRNFLISIGKVDNQKNSRPELLEKCWPNITIKNLTVNVSNKISKVILFNPKTPVSDNVSVGYISSVRIDGMTFHYSDTAHLANFVISNAKVSSSRPVDYKINKVELVPSTRKMKVQSEKPFSYPGSVVFNLRHSKSDHVEIAGSRLNYNVNENSTYNIKYTNCDIGMIRYSSTSNGTKRNYNSCNLYLNNADDARYYIDNQAIYHKSTFIPCDDTMFVSFYGDNNDVTIRDCKTTRKGRLFYHGSPDNSELKKHSVKGSAKK